MAPINAETLSQISRRTILSFAVMLAVAMASAPWSSASAANAKEINAEVNASLKQLRAMGPKQRDLLNKAVGVLVFPKIIKGGFMIGGQYGEGALRIKDRTAGYYTIAAASFGLQAGGQTFSYALLFMNQEALEYLRKSDGWAFGSGPSVVVMDEGLAASNTSTTITHDVVAIPYGQSGLMAGLGLEGSKITPFHPK